MTNKGLGKLVLALVVMALLVGGLTGMAAADDLKHYGVRLRALAVLPQEDADSRLDGLDLKVTNDTTPELDLEYFFTRNISSELILGITKHDITSQGDIIGSTWLLPPTLTVKYHLLPDNTISPYVGAGVCYVIPFQDKLNGVSDFDIDSSFGWAAQVGVDVALGGGWYANADLKYLNVETEMRIAATKYDLDLNPLVGGLGVGYRF